MWCGAGWLCGVCGVTHSSKLICPPHTVKIITHARGEHLEAPKLINLPYTHNHSQASL